MKRLKPQTGKLGSDPLAGLDNTNIDEKQPRYAKAECEEEIAGKNNARIILGRDRNHNITSGYGGLGHTRCGAIDIVVGLQGWDPEEGGRIDRATKTWIASRADKNFGSMSDDKPGDAARIYISQRANIDEYFDICEGDVGMSAADSAIGMKADSIRIMARKGIKLVTGKNPPGRNSMGGKIKVVYGIDLIAGNRDEDTGIKMPWDEPKNRLLQPIPKGDNLSDALEFLTDRIEGLNNILSTLMFDMQALSKLHLVPRIGGNAGGPISAVLPDIAVPTAIQTNLQRYSNDLDLQRKNLTAYKIDYLTAGGSNYINSEWNRTN